MKKAAQTGAQSRRQAYRFRIAAVLTYIISAWALEPLLEHAALPMAYLAFFAALHLASWLLMLWTLRLQSKALSFDFSRVDMRLLLGLGSSAETKRCLILPVILLCALLDAFALCCILL